MSDHGPSKLPRSSKTAALWEAQSQEGASGDDAVTKPDVVSWVTKGTCVRTQESQGKAENCASALTH